MKKAKKKRNPKEYLVGYAGDDQCVYGNAKGVIYEFLDKMTMYQAKRHLRKLLSVESDRVIYKLVPVVVVKGRKERAK